jgi:anti-sigma regulatory factor (Ser/Thr protein kinase)
MVRLTVGALARLHGVDEDTVEDIKLAVSEASTRAVAANAEHGRGQQVRLDASVDGPSMLVEVQDAGPSPEREIQGDPDELDTDELPFDRALAVPLIRGLVDELSIGPSEAGGTRLRMAISLEPKTDPEPGEA